VGTLAPPSPVWTPETIRGPWERLPSATARSGLGLTAVRGPGDALEALLRDVAILGVLGIALIHVLDLPRTLREVPYLPMLYVLLVSACLTTCWLLLWEDARPGWAAAGVLAALTLLAFVASRTIGLPGNPDDIGHWSEPLGVASLFVEGAVVVLSAMALAMGKSWPRGRAAPRRQLIEAGSVPAPAPWRS